MHKETREYLLNLKDDGGDESWLEEVWDGTAEDDVAVTRLQTLAMTKHWWGAEQD